MSRRLTKREIALKAADREHLLLVFPEDYKSVDNKIKLKCLGCQYDWETTVRSYLNSKNGCKSCKAKIISYTQTGKKVSEAIRSLISEKASQRPGSLLGVTGAKHPAWKGGYGRDKIQQSNKDFEWKNAVKKRCHYMCIVTSKQKNLECHHLDGWNLFPSKRYDPSNGVCLHKSIHKMFHDANKYGNNTERQFAAFLFNGFQLDWQKIKIDLQQGNHQPSPPKSCLFQALDEAQDLPSRRVLFPASKLLEEDVGGKVQRLEGEELSQ